MKTDTKVVIEVEDKGHVVVNKCELPPPLGVTVVRLDLAADGESRYRFRVEDGVEGRVSVANQAHYQKYKRHKHNALYLLHKGWIALLVEQSSGYDIKIAFARSGQHFYAEVPGDTWYAAYVAKDAVFTYSSADTDTGDIRDYDAELPDEAEILQRYAEQEGLSENDVLELVNHASAN